MAYTAPCPSCGASVTFRSSISLLVVCEFCRSTLLRRDKQIEDIGKMADLLPDRSIIQIGTEGVHEGLHFAVIGRIQLQYEAGIWNEWHVLFDNMRSGWLSEAGGNSYMTFPKTLSVAITAAEGATIAVGQARNLNGESYSVTNIDQARCIAGQGELPFKVGAGYDVLSVDLRSNSHFATLDFSQDPALFFVGGQVHLDRLKLANTRSLDDQKTELPAKSVLPFSCPRCGAPLTQYSNRSVEIICGSCHAILDEDSVAKRAFQRVGLVCKREPLLTLGNRGELMGETWTVIGFMVRSTNTIYRWEEYLLTNERGEFAWLVQSNGHWSFGRSLEGVPRRGFNEVYWGEECFKHFESGTPKVDYVLGEFYWRVRQDDTCSGADYISPPRMLSQEKTGKEENWTLLEYVERDEIASAFKPAQELPLLRGIGVIQPNPYRESHDAVFSRYWRFALAALAIQLLLLAFLPHGATTKKDLVFAPGVTDNMQLASLDLSQEARNVAVSGKANVNNEWVDLDFTLTELNTGAEYRGIEEVSYYSGVEDGESWSEGSRNFRVYLGDLPPGKYQLAADIETLNQYNHYISGSIEIEHGQMSWWNLILLECLLLLFPLLTHRKLSQFERERWEDSDHPEESSTLWDALEGDDDD